MEAWKSVWRKGIAPQLSTTGLEALAKALKEDNPRLLQGATTSPPTLQCVQDWPVEAACATAICGVADLGGFAEVLPPGYPNSGEPLYLQPPGKCTVADAEEFFAKVCFACDQAMREPAACRWFLNWFDETPRDEMRRELLPEVQRVLHRRSLCERLGLSPDVPDEILLDMAEQQMDVFDRNEMEIALADSSEVG